MKLRCWIIYDTLQYEKNRWFASRLSECLLTFCDVEIIIAERLLSGFAGGKANFMIDGNTVATPDFAVNRTISPLTSRLLEDAGVRVFNCAAVSHICNDKRLTYEYISHTGLPFMNTVFMEKKFFGPEAAKKLSYPLIFKSPAGHGGSEVFYINNDTELMNSMDKITAESFLVQRVCPTLGRDIRVYVLGGEIIAAVLRMSDTFKSNYSLGGSVTKYDLSESEKGIVYKIIKSFPCKLDLVGIDFLPTRDTLYFNEIEDVVGCRMLFRTHEIDMASEFSEYIRKTLIKE